MFTTVALWVSSCGRSERAITEDDEQCRVPGAKEGGVPWTTSADPVHKSLHELEAEKYHSTTSGEVRREQHVGERGDDPHHTEFTTTLLLTTMLSQADAETRVRSWGFSHVFTWTDSPCVSASVLN